jgi:hypothetical protein
MNGIPIIQLFYCQNISSVHLELNGPGNFAFLNSDRHQYH